MKAADAQSFKASSSVSKQATALGARSQPVRNHPRSRKRKEYCSFPSVYLPLPASHLSVDDGLAPSHSDSIALGQPPQTPPPLILLALPPFLLLGKSLGQQDVQLGRGVVLHSVATATFDVEALKRWARSSPGLSCKRWIEREGGQKTASVSDGTVSDGSKRERQRLRRPRSVEGPEVNSPTTRRSRLRPLAMAWSRARASMESRRDACFFGETCERERMGSILRLGEHRIDAKIAASF